MQNLLESLGRALHKSDLWAAIIGAVLGGAISTVGQLITIREARAQRTDDRHHDQIAKATSLIFKLIKIHSGFHNVGVYFQSCVDEAVDLALPDGEPWMHFRPIASIPNEVSFDPSEMALLLRCAPNELFNDCSSLDDIHNGFLQNVRKLNDLRIAFVDKLEPDTIEGNVSIARFSPTPRQRAEMNAINSFIERLQKSAAADEERASMAIDGAVAAFKSKIGLKMSVNLRHVPTDQIVA